MILSCPIGWKYVVWAGAIVVALPNVGLYNRETKERRVYLAKKNRKNNLNVLFTIGNCLYVKTAARIEQYIAASEFFCLKKLPENQAKLAS